MNAPATSPVRNGYSTIKTLHWSSTSLGYMNPSTTCISLADRAVQAVVEHLRAGREMRLQHLHRVGLEKFVNGIVGIFQICQLPCPGRAVLTARRGQPFADAVITQRAFVSCVLCRVKEPATVGASLNAIAATEAVLVIDQHNSIRGVVCGSDRTDLRARRIHAVIAELWHE